MTFEQQKQATLEALDYLRKWVSAAGPTYGAELIAAEDAACHVTNKIAGTPCHESCGLCASLAVSQ